MTADSFEKAKKGMKDTAKGLKDTAKGVEDTAGGVHETAGGVNETAEGVIEGIQDTAERVIEGVKDTVKGVKEGVKEGVEETAEGVKDTAEEVDADTYTGSDDERENREYNESGSKEPMNPEGIAEHEPTAVKRDQGTDIADEGQTGTDSPEAREKFKKSGMTNTK
jgi:hypothetical protein